MIESIQHTPENVKYVVDSMSFTAAVVALTGIATGIVGLFAAVASLVWACIRIWETKTVQNWFTHRKSGRPIDEQD